MPYFDVDKVLSVAVKMIDTHGFESSKSSTNPTWKLVDKYIQSCKKISIEDESLMIIDWVKSFPESTVKSSYMRIAKQIIDRGYCVRHLFGLIVMLVHIYRKSHHYNNNKAVPNFNRLSTIVY